MKGFQLNFKLALVLIDIRYPFLTITKGGGTKEKKRRKLKKDNCLLLYHLKLICFLGKIKLIVNQLCRVFKANQLRELGHSNLPLFYLFCSLSFSQLLQQFY